MTGTMALKPNSRHWLTLLDILTATVSLFPYIMLRMHGHTFGMQDSLTNKHMSCLLARDLGAAQISNERAGISGYL